MFEVFEESDLMIEPKSDMKVDVPEFLPFRDSELILILHQFRHKRKGN